MKYTIHPRMSIKELQDICRFFSEVDQEEYFKSKMRSLFPDSLVLDFNMGRSALQYAFRVMGLQGKEVLLPAYSCPFFTQLILKEKIRPIFLDTDLETFNVDLNEIQEKVSKKTAAVLIIHTYGAPCDLKPILDLKEEYGFLLIEDCAHALGARYRGQMVGNFGDFALFSMYKTIPNAGGAFLVINNKEFFREFRGKREEIGMFEIGMLSLSLGIAPRVVGKAVGKLIKLSKSSKAKLEERLVPIKRCNAFVLAIFNYYLDRIPDMVKKKAKLAPYYRKKVGKIRKVFPQSIVGQPSWMNFSVRLSNPEIRDYVFEIMEMNGVLCDKIWHNIPVISKELVGKYRLRQDQYPNAIKLSRSILNLPFHHFFSRRDIDYIVSCLEDALKRGLGDD